MNYRKSIQDKLITELKALTHTGGGALFSDVKKLYLTLPTSYPSAVLMNTETQIDVIGNDWDTRNLYFELNVLEQIENSATQEEAELKIDRLSNIEDIVLNYLEKIPNSLENDISGIHIVDIAVNTANIDYESNESGIMISLTINFQTKIILQAKTL